MKYLFAFVISVFIMLMLASCSSSGGEYKVKMQGIDDGDLYVGYIDTIYKAGDTLFYPGYTFKVVVLPNSQVGVHYEMDTDGVVRLYSNEKANMNDEYQLRVEQDTSYLYDGQRMVGKIPYSDDDKLSQLIREDNR